MHKHPRRFSLRALATASFVSVAALATVNSASANSAYFRIPNVTAHTEPLFNIRDKMESTGCETGASLSAQDRAKCDAWAEREAKLVGKVEARYKRYDKLVDRHIGLIYDFFDAENAVTSGRSGAEQAKLIEKRDAILAKIDKLKALINEKMC
ncbi:MAG: hypothetical protein CBC49_009325 [Alphaproteobacteria bacterium TMED89]|nr:hypothetical protein [Rhodospirillaceae bacterium]RPH11671.1 MAG: hypothetical protein CBC49_009325 [Alphaproteobacteria bacterium TMED89]